MKNIYLAFICTIILSIAGNKSFAQENKKVAEARKDVLEAQQDLKEAKKDSADDFHRFKKDAQKKIADNHRKIAALKAKKVNGSKEEKEKFDKKVLALEQKNRTLKKQIDECNTSDRTVWESFKNKFSHEMDDLVSSIKNIGSGNKK